MPKSNQELLASLYDRIYEILTYTPKVGEGTDLSKDKGSIRVQMTQNAVINTEDYMNAISGGNPDGDIEAAEAFARLVDQIPNSLSSGQWAPTEGLAKLYQGIVVPTNIDPSLLPSEEQEALHKRLQGLLRQEIKKKSIVTGIETVIMADSPLFTAYKEAKEAYEAALLTAAQGTLDAVLSTNKSKRQATLDKGKADAEAKARYKDWIAASKSDVEEILDALESIKNNAISAAISDARETMGNSKWISSNSEIGQPWMLANATPSNWTEPTCKGTTLTLSSDSLKTSTSSTATTYSTSSQGWFLGGGSGSSGSTDTKTTNMVAESFELSAEMVLVRIQRPWLNELLFTMKGWSTNAYPNKYSISDGKGNGALPAIPISFVMVRNVTIKAKFSESDAEYMRSQSETTSSGGWGWGPFGSSSNKSTSDSTTEKFDSDGKTFTLTFSDPQIIAWISRLVRACPS